MLTFSISFPPLRSRFSNLPRTTSACSNSGTRQERGTMGPHYHPCATAPHVPRIPRQMLQPLLPPTSLCCLLLLRAANSPVLECSARCLLAVATLLISTLFNAREISGVSSFPNTHPMPCSQGATVCYDMLFYDMLLL